MRRNNNARRKITKSVIARRLPKEVFKEIIYFKHPKGKVRLHKHVIYFPPNDPSDKIIFIFKSDDNQEVWEITSVSYETLINDKWEIVIYYDDCHAGNMHVHIRRSIDDDIKVALPIDVKTRGNRKENLTWAVKELTRAYLKHRRSFLKRSKLA